VTAGNFIDLVNRGFYNDMKIQRADGFVVQTGDPAQEGRGKDVGFVPPGSDKVRNPNPILSPPQPQP
jgi:peptidylprolyl isomerase